MPSLTIAERIAANVVETLSLVKGPTTGHSVVLQVSEDIDELQRLRNGLCVVEQMDPEPIEELSTKDYYFLPLRIYVVRVKSEDDTGTLREMLNDAVADVMRALNADHYRGGLAWHHEWEPAQSLDLGSGGVQGKAIPLKIKFHTAKDNPCSL